MPRPILDMEFKPPQTGIYPFIGFKALHQNQFVPFPSAIAAKTESAHKINKMPIFRKHRQIRRFVCIVKGIVKNRLNQKLSIPVSPMTLGNLEQTNLERLAARPGQAGPHTGGKRRCPGAGQPLRRRPPLADLPPAHHVPRRNRRCPRRLLHLLRNRNDISPAHIESGRRRRAIRRPWQRIGSCWTAS